MVIIFTDPFHLQYLTVSKRKSNLKLFIKKLSSRIELLRGFDDDNDTTLNESTLVCCSGCLKIFIRNNYPLSSSRRIHPN